MKPSDPNTPTPGKPPLTSGQPIAGKPWQRTFPTPRLEDYIVSVRADTRPTGFKLPRKGSRFKGIDEHKLLDHTFRFAKAVPVEQLPGFVDLYYIRAFQKQEEFNWTVAYPYVDKHYPQITRTYYCMRSDYQIIREPQADATDPTSPDLFLVDHKIERFTDDPVLDALFVKVIRVFERLPSPTIVSHSINAAQQPVTTLTGEVTSGPRPEITPETEESKQERVGTAKAKNTLSLVPNVFPQQVLKRQIPSMTRELWLGGFQETTEAHTEAGSVLDTPQLNPGEYEKTGEQVTALKRRLTTQALPLPQERIHQEVTTEFGGGVINETLDIVDPDESINIVTGTYITESRLRNLQNMKIRMVKEVDGDVWPVLHEEKVLTEGIYAGIRILIDKQVVPAGTQDDGSGPPYTPNPDVLPRNPGDGYTDMIPHDKWRTLQITSRIDLNSLPPPVTYVSTHPLDIPPTLLEIIGVCGDKGGFATEVSNDGNNGEGVSISIDSGPLGTIAHKSIEGFRGVAVANVTRVFLTLPPQLSGTGIVINGVLYTPFQFLGATGVASLVSIYSRFTQGQNGDATVRLERGSSHSNQGQVRTQTVEFRPMLTGLFKQSFDNVYMWDALKNQRVSGNVFKGADSPLIGATTQDGFYTAEAMLPGNTVTLHVDIPDSNPLVAPPSGTQILVAAPVEEWRFGIWVVHLITAIVP
jgi:hypothetical protein